MQQPFAIQPDWEAFLRCIRREGTPRRVHHIELFLDPEVQEAIVGRFGLREGLDSGDPLFAVKRNARVQQALGYDYVRCGLDNVVWQLRRHSAADTAALPRDGGRSFVDEHTGPITSWEEFERYPWPQPQQWETRSLEWLDRNLPDTMCVVGGGGFAHFAEHLSWLMGYETLCLTLYDQRDLVAAIRDRLIEIYRAMLERILQFPRVKIIWGSDDMGFKTGTLLSPADLREFVLPGHKLMAEMSHAAGRPYLLHCCGDIRAIMPDLIDDVRIDGKHSFEDTIETVVAAKQRYGHRIAVLGGIDVDFLCRASEQQIRERVRRTLQQCLPGGGYCLGTGNSVANYIPLQNYLAMLDEGNRFSAELS
ncbi:MAG: uroporphyrinogen-III decarboxylase-like protein [Verrucomicrobiae bacterium]|nr:uroporphyrinogen-III decarboxylase-like protein [Verrucomicrobiae bacterium]